MHELITVTIPVRWGDMDAFNHVNNSVYATYLEELRLRWFATIPGPWVNEDMGPVVASMRIEYRQTIEWPEELSVTMACERAGRSSLTLAFWIRSSTESSRLYAEGSTVLVWIDRRTGKSMELPVHVREAVA
ncbi:MAG: acyl-CoA thioesterase [Ahniella sp.]|nr:acyl-CoA thioesterase [Ahniella sp.]